MKSQSCDTPSQDTAWRSLAGGMILLAILGHAPLIAEGGGTPTLWHWTAAGYGTGGPDLSEPLVTDRPDFTEASVTVGRGVTQLEMGYTFTHDEAAGDRRAEHTFGELLLRQGWGADWFEFRLGLSPIHGREGSEAHAGLEDLYLGAKLALMPQEGWLPEVAIVPQATVPTGHAAFTADRVLPGVNLLYGWDLSETVATAGSTQWNATADDAGEWAQSWTVGLALAERIGCYAEWFAILPEGEASQHYANGGLTLLLSDDAQFDVRIGVGLSDAADDFFVGSGLSLRWR